MTFELSQDTENLRRVLAQLEDYIWRERFQGYDPYDLLKSPAFSWPVLRDNKTLRFYSQQVFRRIPFNLRPLLRIPKGYNPVTLGLAQHAYLYLMDLFPEKKQMFRERSDFCLDELNRLKSSGYAGVCWGYDFDWSGRYATIPAFTPTVVATGFVTNGLFERYQRLQDQAALSLLTNSVEFVMKNLQRSYRGTTLCFSYSPVDHQQVLNASMKAVRLLAQVYSITQDARHLDVAKSAVQFAVQCQRNDGSWPYSRGDARTWSDNYHTAYVLDCLKVYCELTNDHAYDDQLRRGFKYYRENFITRDFVPRYYNNKLYPIDITCAAQSILTLSNFGDVSAAWNVARWTVRHMYDQRGFFYYQTLRFVTDKTSYMRWSNAWMLLALAFLLHKGNE